MKTVKTLAKRTDISFDALPRRAPTPGEPVTVNLRCPPADVYVPPHRHDWAQLAYPLRGGIRLSAEGMSWLAPALRAVWIPPHIEHDVLMLGEVELRTVYIDVSAAPLPLDACAVIEISDLMRALIEALSEAAPDDAARRIQLTALLLTEIRRAPNLALGWPMPRDRRLLALCEALVDEPGVEWSLDEWAAHVGASGRTLARLFRSELNTSFGAWRQQVRLAHALDLIGRGLALGEIAERLGYAGPAAFTAMFKRTFGVPPSRFLRGGAAASA